MTTTLQILAVVFFGTAAVFGFAMVYAVTCGSTWAVLGNAAGLTTFANLGQACVDSGDEDDDDRIEDEKYLAWLEKKYAGRKF